MMNLKYLLLTCLFSLCSLSGVYSQSATIDNVWVDFNVNMNGKAGMNIHAKVSVHGYMGRTFTMGVIHYFEYNDKRLLLGNMPNYCTPTSNGQLQVAAEYRFLVTPAWDHTLYNDICRFVPYDAFQLPYGNYKLSFHTFVYDYTSRRFIQQEKKAYYFDYGNSAPQNNNNQVFDFNNNSTGVAPMGGGNVYNDGPNVNVNSQHHKKEAHPRKCNMCYHVGNGLCRVCAGSGKTLSSISTGAQKIDCYSCGGSGRCRSCNGSGLSGIIDYY